MLQLALLLLLSAGQQSEVVITSDGPQEREGSIYRVTRNVVVTYQDVRIEADQVTWNESTNEVDAGDRVRFIKGNESLEGARFSMDLDTKAGVLTNASGQLGAGFFVVAEEARRREDGLYEVRNATITTCGGPTPGWTFGAARAVIDPQSQVTARNSIFKLQGIPFFYLPYVIAPTTEKTRSSGFLIPGTSTSTAKGRSIRQSFFYAINRSADAMITAEYFSKRGLTGGVDFRAVPDPRSRIVVNSFFAKDRKGQGGQSARILTSTEFKSAYRGVVDLSLVSSFIFRQIFEEGFNVISSPIQHSLAFLTNNQPRISYNAQYSRTGIFFPDQPSVALRRFPSIDVALPQRPLGNLPVYFSLESGFTGIARRDAAIAAPSFVERFDIQPALEIPILRAGAFDWSHRITARETAYTHSRQARIERDMLNRFSFEYRTQFTGPRMERDFGTWKHVVEPVVDYRYLAGADRFRNVIIVDQADLTTNTNEIEYGVANRLFTSHEVFSWRISQKYFFDPTFGGAILDGKRNVFAPLLDVTGFAFADGKRRFSPIVSTMRVSTSPSTSTDLLVDYDTVRKEFSSAGIMGGVNRGQTYGSIAYFFTRRSVIQTPNNQLRATVQYGNELKLGFSSAFSVNYDIGRSLFQGSIAQVGYNTGCYGLNFEFMQFDIGARKESRIRFSFTLKNIGAYGTIRQQERLF
jgi:LPS-assembly protein